MSEWTPNANLKDIENAIQYQIKQAAEFLRKDDYNHSLYLLNSALDQSSNIKQMEVRNKLCSIAMNHYGTYYKKLKNNEKALECFFKAAEIGKSKGEEVSILAQSHLNICAILSEKQEHERALRHSLKSLYLLRNNFNENPGLASHLGIAYHNVGVEYEFLNQMTDALDCYKKGYDLCRENIGENHEITKKLKNHYAMCEREIKGPEIPSVPLLKHKIELTKVDNSFWKRGKSREASRKAIKLPDNISGNKPYRNKSHLRLKIEKSSHPNHNSLQRLGYVSKPSSANVRRSSSAAKILRTKSPPINNVKLREASPFMNLSWKSNRKRALKLKGSRKSIPTPIPIRRKRIDIEEFRARENLAATIIQAWWKGCIERMRFKQKRVLSAKKRFLKDAEILKDIINQRSAKKIKQKNIKIKLIPRKNDVKTFEEQIVKIQAFFRMLLCRVRYWKIKKACLAIQKSAKMWQCRKIYKKIRNAAIFIQREYRKRISWSFDVKSVNNKILDE
ncbi:unnamed protein product [Blepharisma stoltei]|uniref:Uncharacterized protein n=1 Tax=Blepharisma stoltei TaxID=1481888 RepID=A0AAU9IP44_9CILI|nr:unnamed protein product [Blepharisma stoltei]